MVRISGRLVAIGTAVALCASMPAPAAQAEDFLSALFGAFGVRKPQPPVIALPFASEGNSQIQEGDARPRAVYSGGQAFCVRTCDGRYFPISASDS
jgi:hypothetical protein